MGDRAEMWVWTHLDEYESQPELKDQNDTLSEFVTRMTHPHKFEHRL